jgi:2,3,4,5-tetrahydropyridine-2-carboxylate N-succinyltransferase
MVTGMCTGSYSRFYDKVPLKYANYDEQQFIADGVRVVPDAIVRRGAYVAPDVVLMPSYVNIGANIDSGTMVDTWATVACPEASASAAYWSRCRRALRSSRTTVS